jgi:hypothetical protein
MGVMDARGEVAELADWMRAHGITRLRYDPAGSIDVSVCEKPEPMAEAQEPEAFGIPEALQAAKDTEAQRLQAERDAQWADDQVRYAASEGYRES